MVPWWDTNAGVQSVGVKETLELHYSYVPSHSSPLPFLQPSADEVVNGEDDCCLVYQSRYHEVAFHLC